MKASTDQQLLQAYADRRSETAFAELVRRHVDFVHSAACRMVRDPHLAQDVSQGVFLALAKNAAQLTSHPVLSGWLHRTARNIAAQTVRTEVRRRQREQAVATMNHHPEPDASWQEIAPHLDTALADLSAPDRDAIFLRYFENKPAQEMAAVLGINAEAAQKRLNRAVERLRGSFAKRGLTAGATSLTTLISVNAVQAAPAGLAATFSAAALSTAALTSTSAALQILAMTTLQKSLAAAAIALFAGVGIYQTRQASQFRQEVQNLQQWQDTPSTQSPSKNQTQNSVGLARNSERVVRKNSELEKQNAALKMEKDSASKMLEINRRQNEWIEKVTEKILSDKELQAPQTASEFATLYGQVRLRSRNFYEKWNGKLPPAGSPDDAIYQKELDTTITNDAALMKAAKTLGDNPPADSFDMVQFQGTQLSNALELKESQLSQLNETFNRFYADADHRKLTWKSIPASGEYPALEAQKNPDGELAVWFKNRDEMSEKAFAEILTYLTPQQRIDFRRIYNSDFLWGADIEHRLPSTEAH